MEPLKELINQKIEELLQENKIESIIRHELEERISDFIWRLESFIKEKLVEKAVQTLTLKKFEETIEEKTKSEEFDKLLNKILESYEITSLINSRIQGAFNEIPRETLKNQIVQKAIQEAEKIAKETTNQKLIEIFENRINTTFDFYLRGFSDLARQVADLSTRITRLESKIMR